MEKITIKKFLIFDDIEMELNKFNILIGPQASGKSLITKLIYFFKNISALCVDSIKNEKSIHVFKEILSKEFLNYFPASYWHQNNHFNIEYKFDKFAFNIVYNLEASFKTEVILNDDFVTLYENLLIKIVQLKKEFREEVNIIQESIGFFDQDIKLLKVINEEFSKSDDKEFFGNSVYIPSSRSFFSTLDKNIWTLTDQNVMDIDPFMKKFGRAFEQAKQIYDVFKGDDELSLKKIMPENYSKYDFFRKIVKGEYEEIDDKSWIIGDNYRVNLSRASSGQQEVIPLLMVLICNNFIKNSRKDSYFIEEPEAHLFPDAQNSITSLLLLLFSERNVNFFITTHSPYVLSALNNSIYANELIKKKKLTENRFLNISGGAYPIDLNDISAFSVDNGVITDIKDYEYNMIGGDILDSVSNEFGQVMDQLMELDD